ncbi:RIC1 domain-containing protein [Psidium guajava]|nr:RIC1 domain-containing protein [Psidium guajava]
MALYLKEFAEWGSDGRVLKGAWDPAAVIGEALGEGGGGGTPSAYPASSSISKSLMTYPSPKSEPSSRRFWSRSWKGYDGNEDEGKEEG